MQGVARRDVDLVRQLAGEPDPPDDAVLHPGDHARAHAEVREGVGTQVDALDEPLEQRPAVRAGHVDAGQATGDGRDVHVPLRLVGLQPVLEHLPDGASTRRRGRHQPVVLAEATGHAVIGDDAVLGHHRAVAHPTDVELLPLVDVHQLQELRHVGTAEVQLAQRGHVDQADVGPHVGGLGHGVAVMVRTDPLAGQERRRAMRLVPVLQRRATHRLEDPPGEGAQRDRGVRRPPHGGADIGHGYLVGVGQDGSSVDRLQLALGRAHGHGGVPLHELDGVEALLRGLDEVLRGHVLGEIDHAVGGASVALRVSGPGQRGPVVGHLSRLLPRRGVGSCRLADTVVPTTQRTVGGQRTGGPTVGLQFVGRTVAVHATGDQHV